MDKTQCFFTYRGLDMILNVTEYTVDHDGDVDISEYNIELDYWFQGSVPQAADQAMQMIAGMLKDGDHLADKIMYQMFGDDIERIQHELREAWDCYYEDECYA